MDRDEKFSAWVEKILDSRTVRLDIDTSKRKIILDGNEGEIDPLMEDLFYINGYESIRPIIAGDSLLGFEVIFFFEDFKTFLELAGLGPVVELEEESGFQPPKPWTPDDESTGGWKPPGL